MLRGVHSGHDGGATPSLIVNQLVGFTSSIHLLPDLVQLSLQHCNVVLHSVYIVLRFCDVNRCKQIKKQYARLRVCDSSPACSPGFHLQQVQVASA